MTMKYSLCIEMFYQNLSAEDKIRQAGADGFSYFEFWRWKGRDLEGMFASARDSGVSVSAFSGDDTFSMTDPGEGEKYLSFLGESLARAEAAGCPNLVVHSDALDPATGAAKKTGSSLSFESRLLSMVDLLEKAAPLAEKAGVNLVLEPLNTVKDHPGYFLSDPDLAFDIVRQVDSGRVKVLFDIYHMQIMKGNIIETLEKNLDLIGYIHAADVPGRHEPGTGELSYPNIFRALDASGYEGFIGFELSPSASDREAVRAILETVK
jgi:hydroxypyruvate isomerase